MSQIVLFIFQLPYFLQKRVWTWSMSSLRNSALKRGMFKPSKMCITREIIDKMRPYQIFKIFKIFFDNNFKFLKSDTPSCFAFISVPLYHTEKLLYSRRSYGSLLSNEICPSLLTCLSWEKLKTKNGTLFFGHHVRKSFWYQWDFFFAKGNKTHVKKGKIDWLIY